MVELRGSSIPSLHSGIPTVRNALGTDAFVFETTERLPHGYTRVSRQTAEGPGRRREARSTTSMF